MISSNFRWSPRHGNPDLVTSNVTPCLFSSYQYESCPKYVVLSRGIMEITEDRDGLRLKIYVRPGAKKDAIVGTRGSALKVNIASSPVRGAANRALRKFLASLLDISSSQVEIVSGRTSRHKTVKIMGLPPNRIRELLRSF